jgi:hypothetical protein
MTALTCARCKRAADPDTELLVVVLGVPLCASCAEKKAEEMDAADQAETELLQEAFIR